MISIPIYGVKQIFQDVSPFSQYRFRNDRFVEKSKNLTSSPHYLKKYEGYKRKKLHVGRSCVYKFPMSV